MSRMECPRCGDAAPNSDLPYIREETCTVHSCKYLVLLTLYFLSTSCYPEAEYQIFPGFDPEVWTPSPEATSVVKVTLASLKVTSPVAETPAIKPPNDIKRLENKTSAVTPRSWHRYRERTALPDKEVHVECPESETPTNIGPYEVPTERDLVLHTMKTLHRLFASYHQKSMLFLDDVGKVVAATDKVANKCRGDKTAYKKCVRQISNKCKAITKSLTSSLEQQRQDILAFGKKTICNLEAMKEDPVKLIKVLASEEASLEFALPGFLRLLNSCDSHCISQTSNNKKKLKPSRHSATHLTDTDVVIRHFLTKKNYVSLMKPKNDVYNIPVLNRNRKKL